MEAKEGGSERVKEGGVGKGGFRVWGLGLGIKASG